MAGSPIGRMMSTQRSDEGVVMNHQQMIKPALIGLALFVALGLAGLPVLDYLPLLVLLICPLMMIVMMAAMNHGADHGERHDHSPGGRERSQGR
jgi:heme O synthase-like polyprenyltransferase